MSTAPAEGAPASTASPSAPLRRRRLPAHLGPARTSTVLLAVAFLLIGLLYLFVKPPEQADADPAGNDAPATSRSGDPARQAPETTGPPSTAPSTSDVPAAPEPTTEAPTSTGETPAEPAPETSAPEDTAAPTSEPTTEAPTS